MTATTLAPGGPVQAAGKAAGRRGGRRSRILLRRIGFYLGTAAVAITLNFVIPRLMPGDPASVILTKMGQKEQISPATEASIRALFGMPDTSLWQQYLDYLGQLAHLDFGTSITYFPTPVSTVISQGLPWTLGLVTLTTVLAFLLGTGLGILAGSRPGSRFDSVMAPLATFLGSMPYFWVATMMLLLLSVSVPVFPSQNGYDLALEPGLTPEFIGSVITYGTLPAITIIVSSVGGWLLGMRNMMITTVAEDYVSLAEAKGLSRWRVLLSYAARNAMLPQVASLAISIGSVVGGSLLAEAVFQYPGVGFLFYQAVINLDYPLMQALFLAISLSVLCANFIADSVYVFLDPRTREDA
ncbi:ABC transporter permease [Streptomyces pathocidini]|uniref:ABC transporter permease n=1 Tax=Streptomyces pathocidini TaxID=1650571 RepID=A0ABW7UVC4_9ACTN|nr:ABC transporter permease [Streptomyces pathocidini]